MPVTPPPPPPGPPPGGSQWVPPPPPPPPEKEEAPLSTQVQSSAMRLRQMQPSMFGYEGRDNFYSRWRGDIVVNRGVIPPAATTDEAAVYSFIRAGILHARPICQGGALRSPGQAGWQFATAVQVVGALVNAVIIASGRSSGDQETPLQPDEYGVMWWPCVVSLLPDERGLLPFYCPVLAYNRSRPWYAHSSRVFVTGAPLTEVPAFAQSSSVTIEEVDRTSSDKSSSIGNSVIVLPDRPADSSASSAAASNASESEYVMVRSRGRWRAPLACAAEAVQSSEAASLDIDIVVMQEVSEDSSSSGSHRRAEFVRRWRAGRFYPD